MVYGVPGREKNPNERAQLGGPGGLYGRGGGKGWSAGLKGGGGGPGGPGGWGGGGGPGEWGGGGLNITAKPSPDMEASIAEWKKRMEEYQKAYQERMGADTTQHAIEKAGGGIRSFAAGMGNMADVAAAKGGRGPGFGATGIGDAALAAQAKSASDITLGRQRDLDTLMLGGQGAMNQLYGANPYATAANMGLAQQNLGLQAYLGQGQLANQAAQTQAQMYGSPLQWYQMLMGMV